MKSLFPLVAAKFDRGRFFFILAMVVVMAVLLLVGGLYPPAGGVLILAYHQVSELDEQYSIEAVDFAEQMEYLRAEGYTAISLAEMFAAQAGQQPLPAKPVIITFDDGYQDNYLTALPILQRYGLKATVFIIANAPGSEPDYLTWEQVLALQAAGTEIGSHTLNHAMLTELSPAELKLELQQSKVLLEAKLDRKVSFLAYPFGRFNKEVIAAVQAAGYTAACSGICGLNYAGRAAYALRRVNVPHPRAGLAEFKLRLLKAGITAWRQRLTAL